MGSYYAQKGTLYLTNMRTVYVPKPTMEYLKNIEIPLTFLREVKVRRSLFKSGTLIRSCFFSHDL